MPQHLFYKKKLEKVWSRQSLASLSFLSQKKLAKDFYQEIYVVFVLWKIPAKNQEDNERGEKQ